MVPGTPTPNELCELVILDTLLALSASLLYWLLSYACGLLILYCLFFYLCGLSTQTDYKSLRALCASGTWHNTPPARLSASVLASDVGGGMLALIQHLKNM